jgi:hypothetical protein
LPEAPSKFDPLLNDDVTDHARCVPASAMTLRDYFAAKAMQSYIAAHAQANPDSLADLSGMFRLFADEAYVLANVMLEARDIP